jgi:DNA polymerase I
MNNPADKDPQFSDSILFGHNDDACLVAAELVANKRGHDMVSLFFRRGEETVTESEPFTPFVLVDASRLDARGTSLDDCPVSCEQVSLSGPAPLDTKLVFESWRDGIAARRWLSQVTGFKPSAPGAPYHFFSDAVRQHLTNTGRTMFKGMDFTQVRRMQVDIECIVTDGFEFCNARREGDMIVAIGMSDQTGWSEIVSVVNSDEKTMLERFVEIVRERDPDVIEGHNIFNFDLPYITARAKRHKVKLTIGRNGSVPSSRSSRLSIAERTISYQRFDVFGRHVVDTLFLAQAYDVSERSLTGLGLKDIAIHFGFAARNRTYIPGNEISAVFASDPDRLMSYLEDDLTETQAVASLLSQSYFVQSQILPYSYQNVCVRGNATKIDAMMLREYVRQNQSVPLPDMARKFAGGYTDMFFQGVARDVHHCDVRSLYPSLMIAHEIGPRHDQLGVFLRMLDRLRSYRLDAKAKAASARTKAQRAHYSSLQQTFKILINSFYGYLGFAQGQFNDFGAAEQITGEGRELLRAMIAKLREQGATPIEIDTDGIYFVPPDADKRMTAAKRRKHIEELRSDFADSLPEGIEVEFDGEYQAMYSYKMKNYALLHENGEMTIKGGALRSRGLAGFQREFLRELLRLKLEGKDKEIPALKTSIEASISGRTLAVAELAKTVTLQDAPATYAAKIARKARSRDAAYELALRSEREYRAGDQLTYYVTGEKKSVAAHEYAKLLTDADPANRDENVPYYLAKLDALYKKFTEIDADALQKKLEL